MDGGRTQGGVLSLASITCASWKVVVVLRFYFVRLFLGESEGHNSICRSDQMGAIMKRAIIVIGTLITCTQMFL